MGLPDFLCIGAQKAGTSWLNNVLLENPKIFMPPVNELHFFDRVARKASLRPRQFTLARRAIAREERRGDAADRDYIAYVERMMDFGKVTRRWYETAYSFPVEADVRKGDITPSYLELEDEEIAFARKLLGPVKLILIVRRPADRFLSQLRMWATRDDRTDIPQDEAEWFALFHEMVGKERRGAYSRGIPLWRKHFGAESMLVLPYGGMRSDPAGFIARVEDHVGVSRYDGYKLLEERIHTTFKLKIPDAVVKAAADLHAEEDAFLLAEFGEDFVRNT